MVTTDDINCNVFSIMVNFKEILGEYQSLLLKEALASSASLGHSDYTRGLDV